MVVFYASQNIFFQIRRYHKKISKKKQHRIPQTGFRMTTFITSWTVDSHLIVIQLQIPFAMSDPDFLNIPGVKAKRNFHLIIIGEIKTLSHTP